MELPKTILVPTDFSTCAGAALAYAVALAAKLDARVHVLTVLGLPLLGTEYGIAMSPGTIEEMLATNQKALDDLVAPHVQKAAFGPCRAELGDPRPQIDQHARALRADLIVMGTHGRRGVKRLLLGSVAESVVREAPCPVLLIREEAMAEQLQLHRS